MGAHFEARAEARGLRRDADVADDRNPGACDRTHALGLVDAAFEFHRTRTALFDEPNRRADRILVADLIRSERHVGDDVGARRSAGDRLGVMDDLFDRDRRRFVVAKHDVADAVADQNDVDPRIFHELPEWRVVGGRNWEQRLAFAAFDRAGVQPANGGIFLRLVGTGVAGSVGRFP